MEGSGRGKQSSRSTTPHHGFLRGLQQEPLGRRQWRHAGQAHLPSRRPANGVAAQTSGLQPTRAAVRENSSPRRPAPLPLRHLLKGGQGARGCADAEADMPSAEALGAICVQRFDGSRNSAIHTTYRISLRSSSIREPRYPLLRVVSSSRRQPAPRGGQRRLSASEWVACWGVLGKMPAGTHSRGRGPSPPGRRSTQARHRQPEGHPWRGTVGFTVCVRSIQ